MKVIVTQVHRPTRDAVTLQFASPAKITYKPGQHLSVTCVIDGESVSRTYSMNSSPDTDDALSITIKKVPNGRMSEYLVAHVKEGMELDIDGPFGDFVLEAPDQPRHIALFAAGSGITPIISMIKSILKTDGPSASLFYVNRNYEDIIFRQELDALRKQHPTRFKLDHVLTAGKPPEGFHPFYGERPNRLIIKKYIKQLKSTTRHPITWHLCGPHGFIKLMEESLSGVGVSKEDIRKEHFYLPDEPAAFKPEALPDREVTIHWKGSVMPVQVKSGQSILQAALAAGIQLPHSCLAAQCGTCRSQRLSGEVQMSKNHILTEEELREGQVLLCHGYPLSDRVAVRPIHQTKIL